MFKPNRDKNHDQIHDLVQNKLLRNVAFPALNSLFYNLTNLCFSFNLINDFHFLFKKIQNVFYPFFT